MGTGAQETSAFLNQYESDARAIEKSLVQISWYMRGGITIDQAYRLTPRQRKYALELVEENIERTSKTGIMMH